LQHDPYDQFASGYVGMGNDPGNGTDPTGGFTEPFSTLGNVVVTAKAKAGTTIKGLTTGQTILSTTTTVFRYTNKFFGGDVFETPKDLGNFHVDETNQVWHRLGDAGSQGGTLGTLTEYKPDFFDRWSESNNFFAKLGYGIVDGGGLFIQALTPGIGHANAYHLNGSGANPTEVTEGGVGTMGMMLPGGAGAKSLGWFNLGRPATKGLAAKTGSSWLQGGKTFAQFKIARGGTETLAKISTSTGTQRISTEFHHVFLSQRMQKAYNLPNWLVNNRLNVWKLNTVQHSLIDSYRYNFLRAGFKSDIGWFGKYNWFTKF
jgi:hypothetical protein